MCVAGAIVTHTSLHTLYMYVHEYIHNYYTYTYNKIEVITVHENDWMNEWIKYFGYGNGKCEREAANAKR